MAEHAQSLAGLGSEEIIKLLESLGRINDKITVSRRRPVSGKNISKEVGGKQRNMTIEQAVEYEKKRLEERLEKEKQIKELFAFDNELISKEEINDEIYPKRLTPHDIARSIESAKEKLEEIDRKRAGGGTVFSPTEEAVLHVLQQVKKHEAARIAKYIADRQRNMVLGKTIEQLEEERQERIRKLNGEAGPIDETPEEKEEREKREEEKKQETIRTLQGFGKNIKTLVDEVGEVAEDNLDAAAAIVRQWIGNQSRVENNQ